MEKARRRENEVREGGRGPDIRRGRRTEEAARASEGQRRKGGCGGCTGGCACVRATTCVCS